MYLLFTGRMLTARDMERLGFVAEIHPPEKLMNAAMEKGPQSVRHNVRVGEQLPLDRGAPGRVILAFSGAPGEPYETIRKRG
jgi:enoyl-CoA hydratase/carnithine racemase